MKKDYAGLYEDELCELFRDMQPGGVILFRGASYRPARGINDDGIYVPGGGYFLQIDAHGTRSHVSRSALVSRLAHNNFSIYGEG